MLLAYPDTLKALTNTVDLGFEDVFDKITHPGKEKMRSLLVYVDKVLNFMLNRKCQGIRCTHIHFPEMDDEFKNVLLEFIAIRAFYRSLELDKERDDYIGDRLAALSNRLNNHHLPDNAKALNGGNVAYKNWVVENKNWLQETAFLRSIADGRKSLRPDSILNIPNGDLNALEENLHVMNLEDLSNKKRRAYMLLNIELSINDLCERLLNEDQLRSIKRVILFDCEGKRSIKGYNKRMLDNLIEQDYLIEDLIIFSFDKRPFRLRSLINRLTAIYNNYFQSSQALAFNNSYVFHSHELGELAIPDALQVTWIGERNETLIDLLDLVQGYGLNRIRSISILNILAVALNKHVATYIIKGLFGEKSAKKIFDEEIKASVEMLQPQRKDNLRSALFSAAEMIIHEWIKIKEAILAAAEKGRIGIVVPYQLIDSSFFLQELRSILPGVKYKLYTWRDVREASIKEGFSFILAYRDTGRYPFDLYPSILEKGAKDGPEFRPLFLKMLFGDRYDRCTFFYYQAMCRILKNDFRYRFLDWRSVDARLESMRVHGPEETLEDEDQEDELADQAENIRVEFEDESRATYYPSKPLIIKQLGTRPAKVVRADELPDDLDLYEVQQLDEIYEGLNLFQITPQQEQELQLIKKQHGLTDTSKVLWKVMLRRKLTEFRDSNELYAKVAGLIGKDEIVRPEYFRDQWLDPNSDLLIPRKRKHFKAICGYLELEGAYYRLKLRKSASQVLNSRNSNSKMNGLLTQMINEGLFEVGVDWRTVELEHLLIDHELEEKGITIDNLKSELKALVDLIRDRISLKKIIKIERS